MASEFALESARNTQHSMEHNIEKCEGSLSLKSLAAGAGSRRGSTVGTPVDLFQLAQQTRVSPGTRALALPLHMEPPSRRDCRVCALDDTGQ